MGGAVQTRVKKASRGTYNSMDTRVLHFGLGADSAGTPGQVRIAWPDGSSLEFDLSDEMRNHYVNVHYSGDIEIERRAGEKPGAGQGPIYLPRLYLDGDQ